MEIDLGGKIALVTGASRGIGRAIAVELAKHGAHVVINYRKRFEEAKETANIIDKFGGESYIIQADVSKSDDVERMFNEIGKKFGKLDILINNAGWGFASPLSNMDEGLWNRTIDVNLKSVYLCSRKALSLMKINEYGRIINISSIAGIIGMPMLSAYSAAKAGIIGLTKSLAIELANTKVTVNAIAAGMVRTKMGESLFKLLGVDENIWAKKNTLTGSIISPEEVAALVVFLASDYARNITGQVFVIDSGITLAISKRAFT